MNIDVNNGRSIRKLVSLGAGIGDYSVLRDRAKEFTTDEAELDMLETYYRLVVVTDYLRIEAYDFLVRGNTYNQIVKEHEVKKSYLRNIIYNETRRLFSELQVDPLAMVRKGQCTEGNLLAINSRLEELLKGKKIRIVKGEEDLFTFDIDGVSLVVREFNRNVGEQDFKDLVDLLKYFVKPYQEVVIDNLDKRHIGYLLHLLRTDEGSLTEEDKMRKKYLQMEWLLK